VTFISQLNEEEKWVEEFKKETKNDKTQYIILQTVEHFP